MTRGTYLYDDTTGRVLPKDEALALRAARKPQRSDIYETRNIERGVWVYDARIGELVPKHAYRPQSGVTIRKDIDPYMNVRGEYIGGRKQHRDFLNARGVVEVGNEVIEKQYEPAPGVSEDIRRAMHESGYHRQY